MRKGELPEEPWDIKKIVATIVTIVIIVVGALYLKQSVFNQESKSAVRGVQVQLDKVQDGLTGLGSESKENPRVSYPNLQNEFQKKLDQVKKEAGNLSLTEIASSSPQIQKILKDVRSLQDYPGNQVRQMCENICRSF